VVVMRVQDAMLLLRKLAYFSIKPGAAACIKAIVTCFQRKMERSSARVSMTSIQDAIVRVDACCDSVCHNERLQLLLQLPVARMQPDRLVACCKRWNVMVVKVRECS
jgi:hypothetical protein